ncbi:MAG: hypothetical protein CMP90_10790, partial [Gammaproteobacteria bacterium]|nr:hypothetical protein [Gammaproteobacteria bacterium]
MKLKCLKQYFSSLCFLALTCFSPQILGQISEDEATVTYPNSYFAEYGSVTAKDMLNRIPGVGSTTGAGSSSSGGFRGGGGGSGGRGFGSGSSSSEILI